MNILQPWQLLLVALAGWINRQQQDVIEYLQEENRVLRNKLKGKRIRFTADERRRLVVKGKLLGRKILGDVASIVTPDTILRWHRMLIGKKYDGSSRRGPGRPRVKDEIARETVRKILKEQGIVPAPERRKRTPWSTFLKNHWECISAADLFTVEIWSLGGLIRYHVFFIIKLSTRRVHIAGITHSPSGSWMEQIGRNVTDCVDGFLLNSRYVILDRDPLYTEAFRSLLKEAGTKVIRLPARSPNLNAYAERFVRTIKESCLDRIIFFGEDSMRRAISEFMIYYHRERNHQGLGNRLIDPQDEAGSLEGSLACRERLGGVLRFYHRKAA